MAGGQGPGKVHGRGKRAAWVGARQRALEAPLRPLITSTRIPHHIKEGPLITSTRIPHHIKEGPSSPVLVGCEAYAQIGTGQSKAEGDERTAAAALKALP